MRNINLGLASLLLAALVGAGLAGDGADKDVDLVIRNGKLVDGSGNPWQHGDLAIRGPKIVSHVGLGTIWKCVMGNSHQRPTPAQFEEMKSLVDQAMKDGARGLSCSLAMPPDALATTDDLVELCKVVAKHGGIFVAHIRN